MHIDLKRRTRLISLFLLGCLLLNYPLLSLFNLPRLIWGIPLVYAYIFFVWAMLIVLVGFAVRIR
jgi:hypothetical protein